MALIWLVVFHAISCQLKENKPAALDGRPASREQGDGEIRNPSCLSSYGTVQLL